VDTTQVGSLAANVMEHIEDKYDDDTTVRTVAIVVEVDTGDSTTIVTRCNDDRSWVQMRFLEEALGAMVYCLEEMREGED